MSRHDREDAKARLETGIKALGLMDGNDSHANLIRDIVTRLTCTELKSDYFYQIAALVENAVFKATGTPESDFTYLQCVIYAKNVVEQQDKK